MGIALHRSNYALGVALLMLDRELANRQAQPAIGAENRALEGRLGA